MNWDVLRRKAKEKAGAMCCDCGGKYAIQVHHIRYPAKTIRDTLVFCRWCHTSVHRKLKTWGKQKAKRFYLFIPPDKFDMYDKFRQFAGDKNKSPNQFILAIVEKYVRAKEKRLNKEE